MTILLTSRRAVVGKGVGGGWPVACLENGDLGEMKGGVLRRGESIASEVGKEILRHAPWT